jgi:uracil-DNA glycosylase family 4
MSTPQAVQTRLRSIINKAPYNVPAKLSQFIQRLAEELRIWCEAHKNRFHDASLLRLKNTIFGQLLQCAPIQEFSKAILLDLHGSKGSVINDYLKIVENLSRSRYSLKSITELALWLNENRRAVCDALALLLGKLSDSDINNCVNSLHNNVAYSSSNAGKSYTGLTFVPGYRAVFNYYNLSHLVNEPCADYLNDFDSCKSNIMIIGKNLGYQEASIGLNFVGQSGVVLREYLKLNNFDKANLDIFLTNIFKCDVPMELGQRLPKAFIDSHQFLLWLEILIANPDFILLLGEDAAKLLLDDYYRGLSSSFGYFYPVNYIERYLPYYFEFPELAEIYRNLLQSELGFDILKPIRAYCIRHPAAILRSSDKIDEFASSFAIFSREVLEFYGSNLQKSSQIPPLPLQEKKTEENPHFSSNTVTVNLNNQHFNVKHVILGSLFHQTGLDSGPLRNLLDLIENKVDNEEEIFTAENDEKKIELDKKVIARLSNYANMVYELIKFDFALIDKVFGEIEDYLEKYFLGNKILNYPEEGFLDLNEALKHENIPEIKRLLELYGVSGKIEDESLAKVKYPIFIDCEWSGDVYSCNPTYSNYVSQFKLLSIQLCYKANEATIIHLLPDMKYSQEVVFYFVYKLLNLMEKYQFLVLAGFNIKSDLEALLQFAFYYLHKHWYPLSKNNFAFDFNEIMYGDNPLNIEADEDIKDNPDYWDEVKAVRNYAWYYLEFVKKVLGITEFVDTGEKLAELYDKIIFDLFTKVQKLLNYPYLEKVDQLKTNEAIDFYASENLEKLKTLRIIDLMLAAHALDEDQTLDLCTICNKYLGLPRWDLDIPHDTEDFGSLDPLILYKIRPAEAIEQKFNKNTWLLPEHVSKILNNYETFTFKDLQKYNPVFTPDSAIVNISYTGAPILLPYAALDVISLYYLYQKFFSFDGLVYFDKSTSRPCINPVYYSHLALTAVLWMEFLGVAVSRENFFILQLVYNLKYYNLLIKLRRMIQWDDFNPMSVYHCRLLLYGHRYVPTNITIKNISLNLVTLDLVPIKATGSNIYNADPNQENPSTDIKTLLVYKNLMKEKLEKPPLDPQQTSILSKKLEILEMLLNLKMLRQIITNVLGKLEFEECENNLDKLLVRSGLEVYQKYLQVDNPTLKFDSLDDPQLAREFLKKIKEDVYKWGLVNSHKGDGYLRYLHEDEYLHCQIFQTKETGRFSTSKPNLQNFSKSKEELYKEILGEFYYKPIRSILNARLSVKFGPGIKKIENLAWYYLSMPKFRFVELDYIGAELFMMAVQSGCSNMYHDWVKSTLDPTDPEHYDIHSAIAIKFFNIRLRPEDLSLLQTKGFDKIIANLRPGDLVPANKAIIKALGYDKYRHIAKTIIFGIPYGRGAQAIANALQEEGIFIDEHQIMSMKEEIFMHYPELRTYFNACSNRISSSGGWLANWAGRMRRFPPPPTKEALSDFRREACNFPIQSGVADLLNIALGFIAKLFKEYQIKYNGFPVATPVCQLHDAVLIRVHEDFVDEIVPKVQYIMENIPVLQSDLNGNIIDPNFLLGQFDKCARGKVETHIFDEEWGI